MSPKGSSKSVIRCTSKRDVLVNFLLRTYLDLLSTFVTHLRSNMTP